MERASGSVTGPPSGGVNLFDRLIAAGRHNQEVAYPGRSNIGHPNCLGRVTPQLLVGGFEKLDRNGAAKGLEPKPARRVDVPAWCIAGRIAGWVGEDHPRARRPAHNSPQCRRHSNARRSM